LAGLLNAAPLGIEKFREWEEPTVAFPTLIHANFDYFLAVVAVTIAVVGIGISAAYWFRREQNTVLHGLTERNALARAGYRFLVNKLYLDDLYENVIVASIKGPIAQGAYWFNQHVLDGIVNGTGRAAMRAGHFTYDIVDQHVVDGAANGIAEVTGETGG